MQRRRANVATDQLENPMPHLTFAPRGDTVPAGTELTTTDTRNLAVAA